MAVHSLQQRGTGLTTMVKKMNKLVVLHTYLIRIYACGELDVWSTIADPTVLNYSGLNITFNLTGGRPWMLEL